MNFLGSVKMFMKKVFSSTLSIQETIVHRRLCSKFMEKVESGEKSLEDIKKDMIRISIRNAAKMIKKKINRIFEMNQDIKTSKKKAKISGSFNAKDMTNDGLEDQKVMHIDKDIRLIDSKNQNTVYYQKHLVNINNDVVKDQVQKNAKKNNYC